MGCLLPSHTPPLLYISVLIHTPPLLYIFLRVLMVVVRFNPAGLPYYLMITSLILGLAPADLSYRFRFLLAPAMRFGGRRLGLRDPRPFSLPRLPIVPSRIRLALADSF